MKSDVFIGDSDCTPTVYRHPLLSKLIPFFEGLRSIADPVASRQVQWTPLAASIAAVLMTLDVGSTLATRCHDALACLQCDFKGRFDPGKTYNGLIKALLRQSSTVLPMLKSQLQDQALRRFKHVRHVQGWILLAVDGSKEELPRTRSMENFFGIADNGNQPQALITAIVEVFTGLPWDWRMTPCCECEKRQLEQMIDSLPDEALLLGDGNYVGYPLWSALCKAGKHFMVRVGGNVRLLQALYPDACIERRGDIVYAWPRKLRHRHEPIRLRLIKVRAEDDCVYLLTNVLDRRRLNDSSAGRIYRLRWGIELFYRALKRTLDYAKLRSRSAIRAQMELEWAMVTMSIMSMLGIDHLRRRGMDPRRVSPAKLLSALRDSLLHGNDRGSRREKKRVLTVALCTSYRDNYQRRGPKRSRINPKTQNTPKPLKLKPPLVRVATADDQRSAKQRYPTLAA